MNIQSQNPNRLLALACLAVLLLATVAATPTQRDRTERIRFAPGSTAAVRRGAVAGTQNHYILGAQRGQTMSVSISSEEGNAVFDISYRENGAEIVSEARQWEGTLPSSGDYVITVGSERGNATYMLEVSIE